MLYLTRREEFCASHRLFSPDLSPEENDLLFGKCNNPHGHGHNYLVEVTVRGEVEGRTGMAFNLTTLKELMRREVVEQLDHKNLNMDVDFLRGLNPTAENLCTAVWRRLEPHLGAGRLHRVRIYENERNWVDYYGEK
ncbi:MAG: 6-carboxytetrahydropterin synthase [Nitrospinota bacterium]